MQLNFFFLLIRFTFREITGFLLVYRVFGLKSIGSLFPNLIVIRGHNLLTNYALIIYGNKDLQEVRK
jgi:insulin receptor